MNINSHKNFDQLVWGLLFLTRFEILLVESIQSYLFDHSNKGKSRTKTMEMRIILVVKIRRSSARCEDVPYRNEEVKEVRKCQVLVVPSLSSEDKIGHSISFAVAELVRNVSSISISRVLLILKQSRTKQRDTFRKQTYSVNN